MRASEIIQGIRDGECDLRLDEVWEAVEARRALQSATIINALSVGARVMTDNTTTPKHRRLKLATVQEVDARKGKVVIVFDDQPHKRWNWPACYLTIADSAGVPR
jgi:hypothetical protein